MNKIILTVGPTLEQVVIIRKGHLMCACKCNISSTLKDLHKQHTISPHQRKLKQVSIHSLIKTASEHIKTICNKMEHYILLQELTGVVIGNKKSDSLEFAFFVVFFRITMDDEKIYISR